MIFTSLHSARVGLRDSLAPKDMAGNQPAAEMPSIAGERVDQTPQGKGAGESSNRDGAEIPKLGMKFKSSEEACQFYEQYAQRTGFGATVRNSHYTKAGECLKLVLACSKCRRTKDALCSTKTDCPASIRFRRHGDGMLHLMTVRLNHNHSLDPAMKEKSYRKLSNSKVQRRRPGRPSRDLVQEDGEPMPECESSTERGRMKLGPGNDEAICEFFTSMQSKSANFFYMMDVDREGHLRTVFWADPLSRAAYQYFGDVVSLDTTYSMNKGDIDLVLFLGTDHHGKPVLLGCGLLSDQTTESYVWLFNQWWACMLGRPPKAIITDQSKSIHDAVVQVLPEARHRFCLWNLVRKIPEKVSASAEGDSIKSAFERAVYRSLREDEFEKEWMAMIEKFGLQSSEWFNLLYANRHSWVPVFLKDTFWAGNCDVQCCQSMATFFDGFLNSETSLNEFLSIYEAALQSKYDKEAQLDYESFHGTLPSLSKFYMEEQLSKLYTYNILSKFQDEMKATAYCDVALVEMDGMISTFSVKESIYLGIDIEAEIKEYEVLYDANENLVQCICGYFHFQGILCRHALSVFKSQQVYEIPSQYIVGRWRKDYKWLCALSRPPNEFLHADNIMERYGNLSNRCLQLVNVGVLSDDKYQLALELIEQAEKHLLDHSASEDGQQKSTYSKSKSKGNDKKHTSSQSKVDKNVDPSQMKRRGRPPKKRKDAEIGMTNGSNNMMDSMRTSLADNQSNAISVDAIASHLGGHTGTHADINLMEDANPSDVSFNIQFGAPGANHINTQSGVQFSNTIQGQFDQQTIGWFYQQTPQTHQLPKAPPRRRDAC